MGRGENRGTKRSFTLIFKLIFPHRHLFGSSAVSLEAVLSESLMNGGLEDYGAKSRPTSVGKVRRCLPHGVLAQR